MKSSVFLAPEILLKTKTEMPLLKGGEPVECYVYSLDSIPLRWQLGMLGCVRYVRVCIIAENLLLFGGSYYYIFSSKKAEMTEVASAVGLSWLAMGYGLWAMVL
mgnify:CR=1 FL=1